MTMNGRCVICKEEICVDGSYQQDTFVVELFRFRDRKRLAGHNLRVCTGCGSKRFGGTIEELFDGIMEDAPVAVRD